MKWNRTSKKKSVAHIPSNSASQALWVAAKNMGSAFKSLKLDLSLLAQLDEHEELLEAFAASLKLMGKALLPNLGSSPVDRVMASRNDVQELVAILESIADRESKDRPAVFPLVSANGVDHGSPKVKASHAVHNGLYDEEEHLPETPLKKTKCPSKIPTPNVPCDFRDVPSSSLTGSANSIAQCVRVSGQSMIDHQDSERDKFWDDYPPLFEPGLIPPFMSGETVGFRMVARHRHRRLRVRADDLHQPPPPRPALAVEADTDLFQPPPPRPSFVEAETAPAVIEAEDHRGHARRDARPRGSSQSRSNQSLPSKTQGR